MPKIILRKKRVHVILGQIAGNARRHFIKSFSSGDAGKYKCKATDPSGRSDSRGTTVRMEGRLIMHILLFPLLVSVFRECALQPGVD